MIYHSKKIQNPKCPLYDTLKEFTQILVFVRKKKVQVYTPLAHSGEVCCQCKENKNKLFIFNFFFLFVITNIRKILCKRRNSNKN